MPWLTVELPDPAKVDEADSAGEKRHDYVWAWIDESRGLLRARAFASLSGTAEDEATGSAAVQLAFELGRSIEIVQGRGSHLSVTCDDGEFILSGRVVAD